ncbi:MAG: hypothetical protein IBJ11_05930 [Phycisphaerales bacterium]|nr:hypothetical protein [Phycisphaerales bacterium]
MSGPVSGDRPCDPEWEYTPRQVADLLARNPAGYVLVDCRRPDERARANIEGTLFIPMEETRQRLGEYEALDGRQVIIHCHHGRRSMDVAVFLRKAGIDGVRSMAGGIDRWSTDVDPRVPRY